MHGFGRDLSVSIQHSQAKSLTQLQIKVQISHVYHNTAAQYKSSGKIGFSDVSQAGVIELLFPLHAKAPFKPCEAVVFLIRQRIELYSDREKSSTHICSLPILHMFVPRYRDPLRLLLAYTSAAHTRAIDPPSESFAPLVDWFVVFESVVLYEELLSCRHIL